MAFDSVAMDKRILTDDSGEGVLITDVKIRETVRNDGEVKARMVIGGTATAVLVNSRDPEGGTQSLDESVVCEEGVDLEQADKQLFIDKLNRTFNVEPPLVDDDEGKMLFRLVEGGDAYAQIHGRKVHFQVNHKKNSENGPYGATFYTNMTTIPKTVAATKDSLQAVLAKLRAKQEAKNRGPAEMSGALADILG